MIWGWIPGSGNNLPQHFDAKVTAKGYECTANTGQHCLCLKNFKMHCKQRTCREVSQKVFHSKPLLYLQFTLWLHISSMADEILMWDSPMSVLNSTNNKTSPHGAENFSKWPSKCVWQNNPAWMDSCNSYTRTGCLDEGTGRARRVSGLRIIK